MKTSENLLVDFVRRIADFSEWKSHRDYVGPNRIFLKEDITLQLYNNGEELSWLVSKGPTKPLKKTESLSGHLDEAAPEKRLGYQISFQNGQWDAYCTSASGEAKIQGTASEIFQKLMQKTVSL